MGAHNPLDLSFPRCSSSLAQDHESYFLLPSYIASVLASLRQGESKKTVANLHQFERKTRDGACGKCVVDEILISFVASFFSFVMRVL
jgi:hypothetical protein